jgi:hypothetical protein
MDVRIPLGTMVRDTRSGLVGRVVGRVEWINGVTTSLIVQPPAQPDGTLPPNTYVPEPSAEIIPQAIEPRLQ